METHFTKTLETHSPPSDSVDFHQTLDGSSPSSPDFQQTLDGSSPNSPPTQTPDDVDHSSSIPVESDFNNLSPFRFLNPDDRSDSALALDVESDDEEGDDDHPLRYSPINSFSLYSSSHWAQPWSYKRDTRRLPWYLSDTLSSGGDNDLPASNGSELWSLDEDNRDSDFHWSESWHWNSETESKTSMGAGLANLGNTCFLNAILQCFIHTVPLVQGLCSYNHAMPCDRNSDGLCVLCAFRDLFEVSLTSSGRVVSPIKLVENLSYFSSSFQRFQQEDAHEFLQCFLDRLDSCDNDSMTKDTPLSLQDNFAKQCFGGRLVSKLRCCECGHCSDTYESAIDLSLEIEDVDTLPTALESFTKVEKIEDPETKFTCENCKEEVSVEKQLLLEQAPSVAAFHLKRFKNDGSYVEKIDKNVEFPLELDLLPYTSSGSQNNNMELKYDLYAVVVHIGFSSTSGHYYCFIRSAPDTWYKFDDSKVIRVREAFVLSQEAYILFYAKQGTAWFSSFKETHKPCIDPNISNTSPKSVLETVDHICSSSSSCANNPSSDTIETSDAADGILTECSNGSSHYGVEGSEAKDNLSRMYTPVPLAPECSNGSSHDGVEGSEAKDNPRRMYTPVPLGESNSPGGNSRKIEEIFFPSALEENNSSKEFHEVKTNSNITQTPVRSAGPDMHKDDPPEVGFSIERNHLRSVDQVSCEKELSEDLEEDPEEEQAQILLKKMHSSRSSQLLAAMKGSQSEGSRNKKRSRKMELAPNRNDSPTGAHRKGNLRSFMHPLAAGSFR